jgi:membrane-associated phospholipid phosphatase
MRAIEWINLIFFSFFIVLSWLRPIAKQKRMEVHIIGLVGIILVVTAQFARQFVSPFTADVIRDWLPALLLPMMYWQAGRCAGRVNEDFQNKLQRIDDQLLAPWIANLATYRGYRWLGTTIEVAYLSCYVLVPMGLGVLYLAHKQNYSTDYWLVILPATYACYVFTAFVPTLPPRRCQGDAVTPVHCNMRTLNLWCVRHVTTELNTFPSAHVTSTLGGSLLLLELVPSVGWTFVLMSIGIALGAALGRYHYTMDVVVGAVLAVAVYVVHAGLR